MPGTGTVGVIRGREDAPDIWYSFSSPLMPSTVYVFNPAAKKSDGFEVAKPPVDTSQFETRALFATSRDGTRVPFFLTAKKNVALDGSNPTSARCQPIGRMFRPGSSAAGSG